MVEGPAAMIVLAVLAWGALTALLVVFVRMALRPDAGYGGAWRGPVRRASARPSGITPVAIPPRHVSPSPIRR